MAGRGNTVPKPEGQRRRTNKTVATKTVSASGKLRGPELPFGVEWPAQTREWWETWRRSPQSEAFATTDWDFLLDTALLHAALWAGNVTVASEIRLRVSKMGATPEDRLRLRLEIEEPEAAAPKTKAKASADRRARLKVV